MGTFIENKQQENCPYCHEQSNYYGKAIVGSHDDAGLGLIHCDDGWHLAGWDYYQEASDNLVVACPMCGRDLRSDN